MKSGTGSLSYAAEDTKTNQGSKFKKNERALNNLSRTYIQEAAPGKISQAKYEEQFQFDCKKILHLWLVGVLPGPNYLGLTYDMQKKKIKGSEGSCTSKLSECRIFLQKKKMKLIVTQTELNINKRMYMEARLDIKIFQRSEIKAASEDLIKNEHLYELKKQIDKILAEKNVYLISILKKDEEQFNKIFQYVDSREITRTDIRLAKGEGSKQEQTRRNEKNERNERNKKQKVPKKQFKSREQVYGKVTVSRQDSQGSGKSDNSDQDQDTSVKRSQFKNQQDSQDEQQNQQQEVLETYHKLSKQSNKSSKQSSTVTPTPPTIKPATKIFNQSFPAQILNVKQLKKWIQNQKHLEIQQFTFKLNIENDKQYVQIQLITNKKGDKKINVLNFYLNFSKYLLVKAKYDNVFQYCVGKMGEIGGKRGVEYKLYEGYTKPQIQQYQMLQQFKQKKLQPNKSSTYNKKVRIIILKGIKPNVQQTFNEITQFLQQNSKDPILKYNICIDILQIRPYLTEVKLIQSLKETIQENVDKMCEDYDVVIERVRDEMGKIQVRVGVEKNYYKEFVQQHQQKLITQLKDSIYIQQEIIDKQDLIPQLAQKYLLFNSCKCPGKIALIQTKRGNWVKTTKQILGALNKMDTYSQTIKCSRLPMIEGLFKQLQNQGVKITNQRCNKNKMENILTLVGAKKDLNKATTLLKKHLKQLNSTLLDFHIPLTENQSKVVQKNLKKFKQQLQQKQKTILTFNKDITINALITVSSNSQPSINDPFVVYVMKYNMEYVPYGSIVFLKSKQELKMLDEEVFGMERGKLEKMGKKTVEDMRRKLKFVYREGISSASLAVQQALSSLQLKYDSKEAIFTFFMSQSNQSEYIIQLIKQIHLKMRYIDLKTRVFIFHSSSKSIQTTLKPLQQFQQSYLSRSKIEYYITDSSTNHFYSASGNKKIQQALKNGQKTIYLMGSDLNIKSEQITHLCSFKNQKMIHIASRVMTNLLIYPGKVQFQVDGYNKVFEMPVEEVKRVERQNNSEWVKISLSIYEIDLQKNTQTNIFTDYKRILRKKQTKQQNPFGSQYFNCTLNYKMDEIEITHFPKQQQSALKSIELLKELIEDKKITITHILKNKISFEKFNKLRQFSRDYQVQIQWDGEKEVKVSGFEKVAVQLFAKNVDMLVVETREVMYPKYWEPQKQQIQAFVVPSNSAQFNEVQAVFKIRPIKQLLRIQNKLVYKKFYDEKESLISLNDGKPVKQMRLFHGTNSTDPKIIYQDKQQSFNINYTSDRNYLGKGTYFAEQAKYSINYHHQQLLETGQIQSSMFLCLVLVGESQKFATKTQESKAMKDTNYKDPVKKLRYESSTLFTNGSNIYAVYKNRRAYPEYLIKY